jgi:hypothetical protein
MVEIRSLTFFEGAATVFHEENLRPLPFIRKVAPMWGKKMASQEHKLDWDREAGRLAGEILWADYQAGFSGGLDLQILKHWLHLRSVDDHLAVRGLLWGYLEVFRNREGRNNIKAAKILKSNLASISWRTFSGNQLRYPTEVIRKIGAMVKDFDNGTERKSLINLEAGSILKRYRNTMFSEALRSGRLTYPADMLEKVEEVLKKVDLKIREMIDSDLRIANILREDEQALASFRIAAVRKIFRSRWLDRPERAVESLQETLLASHAKRLAA